MFIFLLFPHLFSVFFWIMPSFEHMFSFFFFILYSFLDHPVICYLNWTLPYRDGTSTGEVSHENENIGFSSMAPVFFSGVLASLNRVIARRVSLKVWHPYEFVLIFTHNPIHCIYNSSLIVFCMLSLYSHFFTVWNLQWMQCKAMLFEGIHYSYSLLTLIHHWSDKKDSIKYF